MTVTPEDLERWRVYDAPDRGEVLAVQLEGLRRQVRRLESNPWFAHRFAAAGVGADRLETLDDLRRFPTMGKADVLADSRAVPPFGLRLGVETHRIREIMTSGGTSGNPPEVYAYTESDLAFTTDLYAMDQYWKGARPGDVAMMVSQIGMLTSPPLNVRAWERIGMPVLRVGPNTTDERVAAFERFRPAVLKLPYAYAPRFVAALRAAGIDPRAGAGIKFVFISGGAYPIEFAQGIQDFFGAPMHEVYGCSQAGAVTAGTCSHGVLNGANRGVLHCYDPAFVTEVLAPHTDEPVQPGEEGELVLTQLWREASPVFRYRMGDRVRYLGVGQCACGRRLTALECGTIARYDDMMRVKGVNLWAHDLDAHILAFDGVEEFNGTLCLDEHGRELALVRMELRDGVSPSGIPARLASSLRATFRVRFKVEVVPSGTVRRFELKQRRWQDERASGLTGLVRDSHETATRAAPQAAS
jgi:phenylacetate-CoA ligase